MLKGMLYGHIATLPIYLGIQYKDFSFVCKKKYLVPTLKYSLPLLPSLLAAWVINLSSQVFIERNFSTSEVAIYALSLKIIALVSIISSAIMTAYNPTFYKVANKEEEEKGNFFMNIEKRLEKTEQIVAKKRKDHRIRRVAYFLVALLVAAAMGVSMGT